MMQIQNDRFIKNWRKFAEDDAYPRYEPTIRPAFERDFAEFTQFLAQEGIGHPKITQCEVTYVNHILAGKGWSQWAEANKVFSFWNAPSGAQYPGALEDFAAHLRFPIYENNTQPIGRLHVDIQPAI